jgi:predicted metalloprotease with PDZ domain
MLPYDFSKESYFETGFVAEGVTTYYGDLFLLRSGVINQVQYFKEVDKLFKRHFENEGRHYASLVESSQDLWVDGYRKSAPGRKVSIYTKGALVALMTDLTIRKYTDHRKSLDQVMRYLWENFGQKNIGYTFNDYKNICKQMAGVSLQSFFSDYVEGITPLEQEINDLLAEVGCQLTTVPSKQLYEKVFGFSAQRNQQQWTVTQVLPETPAYGKLSEQDLVIKLNGKAPRENLNSSIDPSGHLKLVVKRSGEKRMVILTPDNQEYYRQYHIRKIKNSSLKQQEGYFQWLKTPF